MNKKTPLLGAHVSIAGGFYKAIEEGTALHCTAIQIFTKSNRQWKAKPIQQEDADKFIEYQERSDIKVVVTHASYLINLGSANPEVRQKSYQALVDEINRCSTLKIPFLILHPGTAEPGSEEQTAQNIGKNINKALIETKNTITTVLIETMAGQGKSIGHTFEKLATMIDQIKDKNRIGVCFDTCHAFAAGYEFSTKETYKKMWDDFDEIIGIKFLKCLHINNSKKEFNSNVDRHEHIDQGKIPMEAFQMIMLDERFKNIPKIIETPKETEKDDPRNLSILIKTAEQ